ncbi:MAG: HEPN domain-containing protein [Nanoarchaeota archaeon]
MREEIKRWFDQSDNDFDGANYNFNGGKFYIAAFFCQQAVEKALKALFLYENKGAVPQSHSLVYLAKNTSIPEKYFSFLRELTPKFIDTRYPDASVDLPSNIYDEENTKEILDKSKEVLIWIKKKIKS